MSARLIAALTLLAAAPLAAQQDTGMMAHDTGMMSHDTGMMAHDTGMMDHDAGMKEEAGTMPAGSGRMFMGTAGAKATGDYQVTEAGGRQRLVLGSEFAAPDAPDLYLLLSPGATDQGAVTLGKLEHPAAGQSFDLPRGKDLGGYTTLVVWSKKEKRAAATAAWHAPDAMAH